MGLNQTALANGPLVNLYAAIDPGAFPDTYPFQLLNIVAADPTAQSVDTAETDGSIAVQGDPSTAAQLSSFGVLNGASLLAGGVSPGEIATLFGASFGAATVTFDGIPAPILYFGPGQINLVVPYAIQKPSTQLQVSQAGQTIAQLQIPVVDASPAIFAADGSGAGPGAILNQDYTLNSPTTPAVKGSALMIFATGAGQTNPPGVDGQIAAATLPQPLQPVTVTIAAIPCPVFYAGAAPTLIAGMLQVNCTIPANAPTGPALPIVLTVGTTPSPPGITVAIQ